MTSLSLRAHAKINPYLAVGGLRADGFHEIETVFQAIALHDVVSVSPSDETRVACSIPELSGESNLVAKAVRLCAEIVDLPPFEVHIEKNIPMQAGLGGGSSDVASALKLFDRISQGALSPHLMSIGLVCGSDVPFFLCGHTRARGTGRGESLEALDQQVAEKLVVAKHAVAACNTAAAYARLDAMPKPPEARPKNMPYNDFERVAPCESLELLDRMHSFGIDFAGLCGSGSAVFGFSENADDIASKLAGEGYWAISTKTISNFGEPWTP